MFGLITAIDGICFVLFHVEQSERWFFRWRVAGEGWPEIYREWQEGFATEAFARFQPPACGCRVEVEVRSSESHEWSEPKHVRLTPGVRSKFRLRAKAGKAVSLDDEVHELIGAVRDHGVGRYLFQGAVNLEPGQAVEVEAVADGPILANVLLEPGEFKCWDERLEVWNLGACGPWWESDERVPELVRGVRFDRPNLFAYGDPELAQPKPD